VLEPLLPHFALGEKAGEATRTPDIFLGKEVLYQLSYTRTETKDPYSATAWTGFKFFFDLILPGKCCRLRQRPSRKTHGSG
jgi:hypothetical protein